jgi:flagellar hook-basal body complex protein FliE
MFMDEIKSIGPVSGDSRIQKSQNIKTDKSGPSFKDTLNNFLSDVNEMQQKG